MADQILVLTVIGDDRPGDVQASFNRGSQGTETSVISVPSVAKVLPCPLLGQHF